MKIKCIQYQAGLVLGLTLGLLPAFSADVDLTKLPPPAKIKGVTFEKDIRPIFEKSCFTCHGPQRQNGKLRVDTLEGVLKGGGDGKVIEKGNSAKSDLVQRTARLVEDGAMPPRGGAPLTKEQIGLIRAWIDQGTK